MRFDSIGILFVEPRCNFYYHCQNMLLFLLYNTLFSYTFGVDRGRDVFWLTFSLLTFWP